MHSDLSTAAGPRYVLGAMPADNAIRSPDSGAVVRAGVVSLLAGLGILGVKVLAWSLTGATVLLVDAAESLVNVMAAGLVAYTVAVSARPPDEDHPYGHGKAEPLSAMVEGSLILAAGIAIAVEALRRMLVGAEIDRIPEGIAISAVAGLSNFLLALYLLQVARRQHSEALRADGIHLLTDTVTTAGGIGALIAVQLTGWPLLDPLVGLVISANIVVAGARLVRRALGGLLDEADFELLVSLGKGLERVRVPEWCEIHQLRSRSVGSLRHIDLHLVVPRYFSLEEAHRNGDDLERALLEVLEERGDVVVHLDPCRPLHCASCGVEACPIRSEPLREIWSPDVASITREGTV